jgi:hypothetical protein
MQKQLIKVISVVEPAIPKRGHLSPYSCYELELDYGDGIPHHATMDVHSYQEFLLEQELLRAGVNPELLGKYHNAVYRLALWDNREED